ncbi:MAG: DUF1156 domain-containing protein [Mesorhizobium sp.]|nr:MAG: DUF1156 domain-containing protein [Mesorhizobium sp.]
MSDVRLIETWLPIAELGVESVRERTPMTPYPAPNRLHVWWARRPLIASRAATLAALLPAGADRKDFMHALGIHGDPIGSKREIEKSKRSGVRFEGEAYGYKRAFGFSPERRDLSRQLGKFANALVVDPTAGGGTIPLEAARLGLSVFANDLNPVSATIIKATVEYPKSFGKILIDEFDRLSTEFIRRRDAALAPFFDQLQNDEEIPTNYVWARTVVCPYCAGRVPLAPNWKLTSTGVGIRIKPDLCGGPGDAQRACDFEIVESSDLQSQPTVARGVAACPFEDCGRVIESSEIRRQAGCGEMGEQLIAVVLKRAKKVVGKTGKVKLSWVQDFRSATLADYDTQRIIAHLEEKSVDWGALGIIPNELIGDLHPKWDIKIWGMQKWTDMFAPRQLLGHGYSVEIFRSLFEEAERLGISEAKRAAFVYLAIAIDKMLDWNSRLSTWEPGKRRMAHTFAQHAFGFKWTYAEMAMSRRAGEKDWATSAVGKCIRELVAFFPQSGTSPTLFSQASDHSAFEASCGSGSSLTEIETATVDAVVIDPPYGANVMYAMLSDFFYVWLKRTAGLVLPGLFTRNLTDKEAEAVANSALFREVDGNSDTLATRDYRTKMQGIFVEAHRILKDDGIMVVMFTHKDTGAWDALTSGLIEAGFVITASWPVNTEAEGSLHIKDKAAANSTIFLVCRPRPAEQGDETTYWEDVEPLVAKAVRTRVEEFQKASIGGVDLYLASFGPALEEFSRHWPLKRGTPRPEPLAKKRRKQAELFEEEFDPYAVTPEDALDAARREVKTWRLNQLTHTKGRGDLDATTSWFVLAWDAFKAPVFSYDEGLRLARAVGADLDGQLIGKICEKKGSDIKLWDSATRAAKSGLGPADGSRAMIDAIHHAAHKARTRTLDAALDLLKDGGIDNDPQFLAALEAVLEVLPPSRNFAGFDVATGDAKSAADDFDALEKLRRLAFSDKVDEPQQLSLFVEEAA